jgi:hypothetical protein
MKAIAPRSCVRECRRSAPARPLGFIAVKPPQQAGGTALGTAQNLRGRDVPIPRRPNSEKTRREDTPPTLRFRPPDARAPFSG